MNLRLLALGSLAILGSSARAVVWRDDITDAQVQAFGTDPKFAGVGKITIGGGFGTGTFIGYGDGSAWVLTANHVLTTGGSGTFSLPGVGSWAIAGAYRYPGEDVSIGRLTGFSLTGLFTPTLNLAAYAPNQPVVSAGFGLSRPQASDTYNDDGKRRGFQTVSLGISFFSSSATGPGNYIEDRFDAPTDPNVRPLEGFGAPGDSGSMLLNASGAALGVLSFGGYEKYGATNQYAALRPEVSRAIYDFTKINPVPEPASVAALGVGALALLRRRRR